MPEIEAQINNLEKTRWGERRLSILPDANVLRDRIDHAILQARRQGHCVALFMLDLDRFSGVIAKHGKETGNLLLQEVAQRLLSCVRQYDTVVHLQDDSFMILLPAMATADTAARVAERIMTVLGAPFVVNHTTVSLRASIGISVFPHDAQTSTMLLDHADIAMYCAKAGYRNTYQFYTPAMNETISQRRRLDQELRLALQRSELIVYYQPRVSLRSGFMTGMEALVRWNHPDQGVILPTQFLSETLDPELMLLIDEYVIRTACIQVKTWQEAGLPPVQIAVNVSPQLLLAPDVVARVSNWISSSALPPEHIELDISHRSVALRPERVAETLRSLRALGVRLTLDDFDVQTSALGSLKTLPLDVLKIDIGSVPAVASDAKDGAIVGALLALAHSLSLVLIAEGVETDAQRIFLSEQNCDEAQGYSIGKPVPGEIFEALHLRNKKLHRPAIKTNHW